MSRFLLEGDSPWMRTCDDCGGAWRCAPPKRSDDAPPWTCGACTHHTEEIAKLTADNAALMEHVRTSAAVSCEDVGDDLCGACMSCLARDLVSRPQPGDILLEEHRKALVRAKNEGLDMASAIADAARRCGCNPYAECVCDWSSRTDGLASEIRAMKQPE